MRARLMRRRFIWSSIIATIIMIPIGIGNFLLYPSDDTIPADQRTPAQEFATQQRNSTFFTITTIQMELSWIIGFIVTNEYFQLHPSRTSMIDIHSRLTGIDKEFYQRTANDSIDNEAKKDASDVNDKEVSKGESETPGG